MTRPRQTNQRRVILITVVFGVIIMALIIAVIVLASQDTNGSNPGQRPEPQHGSRSLLEVYNVKDGLDFRWFPGVKDQTDVTKAIRDKAQIIETGIVNIDGIFYTSQDKQLTLATLVKSLKSTNVGLKIMLEPSSESTTNVRKLLGEVKDFGFTNPVIVSLRVFSGKLDIKGLLSDAVFTEKIVVSFDLTSECCDTGIGRGSVEHVDLLQRLVNGSSFIEVDVRNILQSWEDLKWLLTKNDDLMLIISANTLISDDALYDMLTVRNDIDSDKVLYSMDESALNDFRHLASTAGSPLIYFDIHPRDAGKVVWSHNTDTWEQLNEATSGNVMMIEGDIMVLGQNTPNQTDIPIMAHNVGDNNNLTFEQWLDEIIKVDKGMKLDFKSLDAVKPALKIVKRKRDQIKGPVWLNADILKGPKGRETRIPAGDFLESIQDFPEATLSLGWTTVAKGTDYNLNYTMGMVTEMYDICRALRQPVTFPVRAEQLVDSWSNFDWLLKQSRGYTLTVWTSPTDNVTKIEMDFIKKQAEASIIYFDLPENLRPSFS